MTANSYRPKSSQSPGCEYEEEKNGVACVCFVSLMNYLFILDLLRFFFKLFKNLLYV